MTSKEFLQGLPSKLNADVIANLSTTFHFDFSEDNGGQVSVSLADGQVKVDEGFVGTPSCTIKCTDENFKKILKKELNPMMAILSGKLKISNQGEMLKFAKVLGWM
ncbi:MAG TPA: SCP2 sterol-binding domain-containing protein [Saprospiraceae bacterium]|jgi:putative sterol carrier protein|nr:SCP2 sterol-binding domain-containing protein [Saprospiraceae bacterium]MBK8737175.1 SCP2 sterol-binding domain-containing protein [Saprospiraceae bacterium]HOJ90144.1 SCP2 sterol-binding domain-containing protein [Saprospiraceae bacterium]HUN17325.1 SCP2 sterol-binding domain-containing protein [Saprospiraceae bacterium]